MAIQKTIHVGSKDIPMRASALIPKLYRAEFGRDLVQDMKTLRDNYNSAVNDQESLSVEDLTIFENVAYMMAKHAHHHDMIELHGVCSQNVAAAQTDPFPPSADDWLDELDGVFSIYEAMPQMMELYSENLRQTSIPAKK